MLLLPESAKAFKFSWDIVTLIDAFLRDFGILPYSQGRSGIKTDAETES